MASPASLNRTRVERAFFGNLQSALDRSVIRRLAFEGTIEGASARFGFVNGPSRTRRWDGPRTSKKLQAHNIDVTNHRIESSVDALEDNLRRDQTGELNRVMNDLPNFFVFDMLEELYTLLNNGDTATSGLAYDGKNFFAASGAPHVDENSGNIINDVTATEVPELNVTTATAPTPEEFFEAVMATIGHMRTWKDNEGRPAQADATQFMLLANPTLGARARIAVSANNLAGGGTNPIIADPGTSVVVHESPTFDWGDDEFAIVRLDGNRQPLIMNTDDPARVLIDDADSQYFRDFFARRIGVTANVGFGYGEFRSAIHATMS